MAYTMDMCQKCWNGVRDSTLVINATRVPHNGFVCPLCERRVDWHMVLAMPAGTGVLFAEECVN